MLGAETWPAGVPAQIHYTLGDPMRRQEWIDAVVASIRAAEAPLEVFDYPGEGHLFTDASLSDEYDPEAAALLLGARPHVLRQGRPMSAVGLHHVVAGSGPPLLLLHGFPQTHCAGTP